ncbi:MAG TPA: nucleoside kinase [Candidatus Onthousia excrementipullorum]|uniref:Nucleoside kinase n=1 Tax=Candidatus Onthousia excrementipullorum TaxID=2840884 RepID=A0A9D1DUZ2_9FIRM|nr:nucleoside kinase [Candidatus Onthousia excrementipullorum]
MIEEVKVTINGKEETVPSGITLLQLSKEYQKDYRFPIILASVNNVYRELSYVVNDPCGITFYDLNSKIGNRAHISGLTFLLIVAVKEIFGLDANIIVMHSLDKGIYIKTSFPLTETILKSIARKMLKLVDMDLSITKVSVERISSIHYFESINDLAKAKIMKYNTNTFITLYRLGNYYNYFYGKMPPSTSCLKDFKLTYVDDNGFVLQFPTEYSHNQIKAYTHHPNMFKVFKECRDWTKLMKIETIADLNEVVSRGKIADLIRIDETLQSNRLLSVARKIVDNKKDKKIILLAGPSSSGKTTTTTKLCMYLKSFGLNPKMISMDDYFVDRDKTPVNEKGEKDYECFEAVDNKLLTKQINELLEGKEVMAPIYNFKEGVKEFVKELKLDKDDILLIEGIHALNPKVLKEIPAKNKFKIYLSALTELNIDYHNRFPTTDNRLLRRIIRDNRTRGYNVVDTLKVWNNVRGGEEKYIFPYQDEADVTINTALIYELGVLKTYVEPLLYSVDEDSAYYEEAKRLLNILRLILPIPSESIPDDSILREFIGGSCYHD